MSVVYWSWDEAAPTPDPMTFTRARAAKMLRAWRRNKYRLKRVGLGHFVVKHAGVSAHLIVRKA